MVHSCVYGGGIYISPSAARGCVSEMQRVVCQSKASQTQGERKQRAESHQDHRWCKICEIKWKIVYPVASISFLHTCSASWILSFLCHNSVLSNSAGNLTAFLIVVVRTGLHLLEQINLHSQSSLAWPISATKLPVQSCTCTAATDSQHHSVWRNPWNTSSPISCSN